MQIITILLVLVFWYTFSYGQEALIDVSTLMPTVSSLDITVSNNMFANSLDKDPTGLGTCTQTMPAIYNSKVLWTLNFGKVYSLSKIEIYAKPIPSTSLKEMSSLQIFVSKELDKNIMCASSVIFESDNKATVPCVHDAQYVQIVLREFNKALNLCDVRFYEANETSTENLVKYGKRKVLICKGCQIFNIHKYYHSEEKNLKSEGKQELLIE